MNYSIPLLCYVPSAKCQVSGVKLMRPDASAALVELIPAERKGMLGCFAKTPKHTKRLNLPFVSIPLNPLTL